MTLPTISLITIVKDNEVGVRRAIESVLAQDFSDFEYIIVNDGSSDGTSETIDEYARTDNRIRVIHHPLNRGRAMSRNTGLDAAVGTFVSFLDADDYLAPTALGVMRRVAHRERADIVFGGIKGFDLTTGEIRKYHYTNEFIRRERHGFRLSEHLGLLRNHTIIGRLYRKQMLDERQILFSTTRRNAEDVCFSFYTAFYAERMSMLPNDIVYYYGVGNFLGAATESKLHDACDNVLEIVRFSLEHGDAALVRAIHHKAALYVGDLERAKAVYGLSDRFRAYLPRLQPLIENLPPDLIEEIPPYNQRIIRAYQAADYDRVIWLFAHKDKLTSRKPRPANTPSRKNVPPELRALRQENRRLARELECLYMSLSWRLTAPVRALVQRARKLQGRVR